MINIELVILIFLLGLLFCISIYSINLGRKIIYTNDETIGLNEKIMINIIGIFMGKELKENREKFLKDPKNRKKYGYYNILRLM